jgi:sugar lactone lactonase YvrE
MTLRSTLWLASALFLLASPYSAHAATFTSVQDGTWTDPNTWGINSIFGSAGSGDGQFNGPIGIVRDSLGNLYVVDRENDRVQKFDSEGTFITKWGTSGAGDGQFTWPNYIAIDSGDNLYVGDTTANRIQKFDSDGIYITKWGSTGSGDGEFTNLQGLAVDSLDNIYVSDGDNDRIQKFDSDGNFISEFGTSGTAEGDLDYPTGIALDSSDNIYIAEYTNRRISKFASTTAFISTWGWGVQDGADAFQVCTSGCQVGVSTTGAGGFNGPTSVSLDKDNDENLYIGEYPQSRVQKFTSEGGYVTVFANVRGSSVGSFNLPSSLALNGDGTAFVTDIENGRVKKISISDGTPVLLTDCSLSSSCVAGVDYPSSSDSVVIAPDTTVIAPSGNTTLKSLYTRNGGTLSHGSNDSLTVTDGWGNESVLLDEKGPFGMGMQTGPDGFPRIVYIHFDDQTRKYIRCTDEDCTTFVQTDVGSDNGQFDYYPGSSILALGSDGFGRIVYMNADGNITFVQCLDADCTTSNTNLITSDNDDNIGYYGVAIVMGDDDLPRIQYEDYNTSIVHFVRCTVADCSTFVNTEVAADGSYSYAQFGIAIGPDHFARILYESSNSPYDIQLVRCTDADCTSPVITAVNPDAGNYPGYTGKVITIGSDGFPRIAHVDYNYDLWYLSCTDDDCTAPTVTQLPDTDGYSSDNNFGLALRPGDLASISYEDSDGLLHLLSCSTSTCSSYTDVTLGLPRGLYGGAPVVIGPDNLPRIAYSDYDTGLYYSIIQEAGSVFAPEEEEESPQPEEEEDTRTYGSSSSSQSQTPLGTPSVPALIPDTPTCLPGHLFNILTGARCSPTANVPVVLTTSFPPGVAPSLLPLSQYLSLGSRGPDVFTVQKLLNSLGYTIATTGPGSPGQETDFFGLLTRAAVIKYQKAHNIAPAIGNVGPLTRAALNAGK